MCEPAHHENCEVYTSLIVEDPANGETRDVDVCLEHFEAVKP